MLRELKIVKLSEISKTNPFAYASEVKRVVFKNLDVRKFRTSVIDRKKIKKGK